MPLLSSPLQVILTTPPATRAFTIALLAFSAAYFYLSWTSLEHVNLPYLTLVPGESFIYPWTLLTAGFVEPHFIELIVSLFLLPASLRYLERLWGVIETVKFVVIVLGVSNVLAFGLSWLEYFVLGSEVFIYGLEYHGQMALQTGVLVAFTQLIPEHQVQFFGSFTIRVKRLPMIYVTISNIFCILGYQSPWILIQFGWLVSWAYLRFYKRTTDALSGINTYGDRSETFAFIQWFPPFVHKPLSVVSTAAHNLAVKIKIIKPFSPSADDLEAGVYSTLSHSQPGGARAEAERRRALALKALDSRLANSSNTRTAPSGAPAATAFTSNTGASTTAAPNGPAHESSETTQSKEVDGK